MSLNPLSETLVGDVPKGDDIVVRVRLLELEGEGQRFLDIREFVPSSETYGRGVLIPPAQAKPLLKVLMEASRSA